MKLIVNKDRTTVAVGTWGTKNENDYEILEFEFPEELENYNKRIVYYLGNERVWDTIVDNKAYLTNAITAKDKVKAYVWLTKENTEREADTDFRTKLFEMKFYDNDNADGIVPTEQQVDGFNTMLTQMNNAIDEINDKIDETDAKIQQIDEAITGVENLNIDVSDKVDGDVTVTLTKKDASTKTVVLSDGTSLMFQWNGTSLGIKTEDDAEYTYVDLQGVQGPVGPKGDAFVIKKTYSSVAEMNADFNNMQVGDYVMIASTVELEDNAKLYTKGEQAWIFISDFSGAQGIKGETGATPNIQIGTVVSGSTPNVTRTGTNENPVLNFTLVSGEKGDKGDKGDTGATGNGIASIDKTSTVGYVDTYTITYTNGNTTTFTVTNGEVTQQMLDNTVAELQQEIDELAENMPWDETEQATEITVTDAAKYSKNHLKVFGNTEQASYTAAPNPDYPQDIHVVTGNNTIGVQGKNLINIQNFSDYGTGRTNHTVQNNTIIVTAISGGTYRYAYTEIDNLKIGETYTVKIGDYTDTSTNEIAQWGIVDSSGNYYGYVQNLKNTQVLTFVPTENKVFFRCGYLQNACENGNTLTLTNIQIEQSSTATSYEPYYHQDYPLNLGSIELCKIENYQDYIYKENGNWYKYGAVGNVVLDGSEDWTPNDLWDEQATSILHIFTRSLRSTWKVGQKFFLSDRFRCTTEAGRDFTKQMLTCHTTNNDAYIFIDYSYLSDVTSASSYADKVTAIKTWLSTHNTTVYYVLDTPTITQITDTTLISQLEAIYEHLQLTKGINNITVTASDLAPNMKLTYMQDLKSKLDNIDSRLALLE